MTLDVVGSRAVFGARNGDETIIPLLWIEHEGVLFGRAPTEATVRSSAAPTTFFVLEESLVYRPGVTGLNAGRFADCTLGCGSNEALAHQGDERIQH